LSNSVSVIDTATDTVETIRIINETPTAVAASPDSSKVYVTNSGANTVSVIDTATNTVINTITVGFGPFGLAVTPNGKEVFTANRGNDTVSVIDTATDKVAVTIPSGTNPTAFGKFIQPLPNFAGTPGQPNCRGVTVSALAQKYGELSAAAAAFGLAVMDLQNAIGTFGGGSSQTF